MQRLSYLSPIYNYTYIKTNKSKYLEILVKLFKNVMINRIRSTIQAKIIILNTQFGFRARHSQYIKYIG